MNYTILTFENLHQHGELFANLFRARKVAFIDKRGWDLPVAMGMEYDQYDTPASAWLAIHEGEEVFGGVRLTPTTHKVGIYTYMLKDAQEGRLPGMPTDLLDSPASIFPEIWETSRGFILDCGMRKKL